MGTAASCGLCMEPVLVGAHGGVNAVSALQALSWLAVIFCASMCVLLLLQAVPCNAADHIFCRVLGFHAVDVAFAGYTGGCRVVEDAVCPRLHKTLGVRVAARYQAARVAATSSLWCSCCTCQRRLHSKS